MVHLTADLGLWNTGLIYDSQLPNFLRVDGLALMVLNLVIFFCSRTWLQHSNGMYIYVIIVWNLTHFMGLGLNFSDTNKTLISSFCTSYPWPHSKDFSQFSVFFLKISSTCASQTALLSMESAYKSEQVFHDVLIVYTH